MPFEEARFVTTPPPKVTVLPVAVKPVPVIVTLLPTAPEEGERDWMLTVVFCMPQAPFIWSSGLLQLDNLLGTKPSMARF